MSCDTATKNRSIHICFVALEAYPLFNQKIKRIHGGSAVDILNIATELKKDKNFQVSLVTGDYNQPEIEVIDDITIYKTKDLKTHPAWATLSIWKAMNKADADIYFRKTSSLVTFLVALFCRVKGKVFFYRSAHKTHCDGTYLKKHPLRGRLFKWAVKQAKVALVQNRTDAVSLKRTIGVDSVFIPNGHYLEVTGEKKRDSILWVGRTARFKRPRLFVRLAKEFPNEKFVMICPPNRIGESYADLKLDEAGNIEFHEQVPFQQIDDYFQRAKVFVNTSDSEGFPNTFIQACKCSTPILSLNVNPDGFLDKYNCGVCSRGDWKKFVDSLKYMLAEDLYIELGRNGRKYAEENHDITKNIEQYKKLFISAKTPKTCP